MGISKNNTGKNRKPWPKDCVWPEPFKAGEGEYWDPEDAEGLALDEDGEEMLEIKAYMDGLVEEGRLNEDYSLNEDYEWEDEDDDRDDPDDEDSDDESCGRFTPETGDEYWDDGFDIEGWEEEFENHINLLKLPLPNPTDIIREIIEYEFINENLLRQAFTRKAFGAEYGTGDSEVLEFIGDSVLNTVVIREIARHLTDVDTISPEGPFRSFCTEGELTKIREHYVSKEYLSERAAALGLDQYILYATGEQPSESAREDMMEALIGAAAVDCGWDWHVLAGIIDRLLCIQLYHPREILRPSYYDIFNSWHQKKFGRMPEYEVSQGMPRGKSRSEYEYYCTLRYNVPVNDRGVWTSQRVDVRRETRSKARELAAEMAYRFVTQNGLWINLADSGIEPKLEDSINQLQELYQKKYVEEKPEYSFEEWDDEWHCTCYCGGFHESGRGKSKTAAKKQAAFIMLVRLMKAAGINREEWKMIY